MFDAYATIVLPEDEVERELHDRAIVEVLVHRVPDQPWWLGYLDTGSDDVIFPDAPRATAYADWDYVLVQAGPEQAANWRVRRRLLAPRVRREAGVEHLPGAHREHALRHLLAERIRVLAAELVGPDLPGRPILAGIDALGRRLDLRRWPDHAR